MEHDGKELHLREGELSRVERGQSATKPAAPSEIMQSLRSSMQLEAVPAELLPRRDIVMRDMERRNSLHKTAMYSYGEYADMPLPRSSGRVEVPDELLTQLPQSAKRRLSMRLGVEIESISNPAEGSNGVHTVEGDAESGSGDGGNSAASQRWVQSKINTRWSRFKSVLSHYRVPYVDWDVGNILTFLTYLTMNLVCVLLSPSKDYGTLLQILFYCCSGLNEGCDYYFQQL